MSDPEAANNWGANNKYWYAAPQGFATRFRWLTTRFGDLAEFNATPGEENGSYITEAEKDRVATSAKIPAYPEAR